jgi:hypothetical protein
MRGLNGFKSYHYFSENLVAPGIWICSQELQPLDYRVSELKNLVIAKECFNLTDCLTILCSSYHVLMPMMVDGDSWFLYEYYWEFSIFVMFFLEMH